MSARPHGTMPLAPARPAAAARDGPRAERPAVPAQLRGLFILLFLEIYGASLTIPVFQYFCMVELRLSATTMGFVVSSFSLAQLLGAPVVGRWSDAAGRRPALLGCFFWTSVCFLATAGVRNFSELLLIRTLAGLSGGSIPVTQAMVMDATMQHERPKVLGAMGGVLGVAFTLGPGSVALAISLAAINRRLIFVVAAGFALLGCLIGMCVLQETLPEEKRRKLCERRDAEGDAEACFGLERLVAEVWQLSTPGMVCILAARFFAAFASLCLFSTYSFLVRDAFGWQDKEFGLVLAISGLASACSQLLIYPTLSRGLGKHVVFTLGAGIVASYFVLLPIFTVVHPWIWSHLACQVLFIVGSAVMDAGIPDLVGFHAREDAMGLAQGLTNAFRSLASVLAPLAAGRMYDVSPMLVYLGAAAAAATAGAFAAAAGTCARAPAGAKSEADPEEVEEAKYRPIL